MWVISHSELFHGTVLSVFSIFLHLADSWWNEKWVFKWSVFVSITNTNLFKFVSVLFIVTLDVVGLSRSSFADRLELKVNCFAGDFNPSFVLLWTRYKYKCVIDENINLYRIGSYRLRCWWFLQSNPIKLDFFLDLIFMRNDQIWFWFYLISEWKPKWVWSNTSSQQLIFCTTLSAIP